MTRKSFAALVAALPCGLCFLTTRVQAQPPTANHAPAISSSGSSSAQTVNYSDRATFFYIPGNSQGRNHGDVVVYVYNSRQTVVVDSFFLTAADSGWAPVSNGGYRDFSGSYTVYDPVGLIRSTAAQHHVTLPSGTVYYRYILQSTAFLRSGSSGDGSSVGAVGTADNSLYSFYNLQ